MCMLAFPVSGGLIALYTVERLVSGALDASPDVNVNSPPAVALAVPHFGEISPVTVRGALRCNQLQSTLKIVTAHAKAA